MRTIEYVTRVIDGDTFTTADESPNVRFVRAATLSALSPDPQ